MRHPSSIPIEIIEGNAFTQTVRMTQNVSLGGLAFEAIQPLPLGTVVSLRIPFVQPVFSTTARVVWCSQKGDGYDLGVEFLEVTDVFRARMVEQICHIEQHRQLVLKTEGRALTSQEAAMEWISKFAASFPQDES